MVRVLGAVGVAVVMGFIVIVVLLATAPLWVTFLAILWAVIESFAALLF